MKLKSLLSPLKWGLDDVRSAVGQMLFELAQNSPSSWASLTLVLVLLITNAFGRSSAASINAYTVDKQGAYHNLAEMKAVEEAINNIPERTNNHQFEDLDSRDSYAQVSRSRNVNSRWSDIKGRCTNKQFPCPKSSKGCIGIDDMCNGIVQCPNGEDEDSNNCFIFNMAKSFAMEKLINDEKEGQKKFSQHHADRRTDRRIERIHKDIRHLWHQHVDFHSNVKYAPDHHLYKRDREL